MKYWYVWKEKLVLCKNEWKEKAYAVYVSMER